MWVPDGRTARAIESSDLFECRPEESLNFGDTGADVLLQEQTDDQLIKDPRVNGIPNRRP